MKIPYVFTRSKRINFRQMYHARVTYIGDVHFFCFHVSDVSNEKSRSATTRSPKYRAFGYPAAVEFYQSRRIEKTHSAIAALLLKDRRRPRRTRDQYKYIISCTDSE